MARIWVGLAAAGWGAAGPGAFEDAEEFEGGVELLAAGLRGVEAVLGLGDGAGLHEGVAQGVQAGDERLVGRAGRFGGEKLDGLTLH